MRMNPYEAKQAARKERLEERAEQQQQEANAALNRARQMSSVIPFGQPILVGHHSERRDRNYRERIHNTYGKAFALNDAAKRTAERAASVGTGGISSDDPDAVVKLRTQLANLEANQQTMSAINAAWRKAGKPKPDDQDGWKKVADATGRSDNDLLKVRKGMAETMRLMPYHDKPFQPYELSNNNANIRRVKQRIEQLTAAAERAEACPETETTVNGVRVVENAAENRLQLFFPGKPSDDIRAELKGSGFRWSPNAGAWQRHLSNGAKYAAECILKKLS
jgi:hypothetical protein